MVFTTVERTLTANDFGGKDGHGGVVIPKNSTFETDLRDFFEGVKIHRGFIDVRDKEKKVKLQYADYRSNGSSPNDRVTSINKYAKKYGLEVCDTLILEKVENGGEKTYLIDYAKKLQSLYLLGKRKGKASNPNLDKFNRVISDAKTRGLVTEPTPGEFHFEAKYRNRKRQVILSLDPQGLIETTIDGEPIGFTSMDSYEVDFAEKPIIITKAQQDWVINVGTPKLFTKLNSIEYNIQEQEEEIEDEDFDDVSGAYTPVPFDKKALKDAGSGRKIYPRDKKISANALKRAHHTCEYCPSHRSFMRRKKNIKYMEPHHLIPLHMHEEFAKSLDVEANIVSLCSNCHNQIHYGNGKDIISRLWDLRHAELATAQIDTTTSGRLITKSELLKIYGY